MIVIIAAMSRNRVIGKDGRLPWNIPADLKKFRELTVGHTVLMGRKTFESIGRPLPDRKNIVLSRNPSYNPQGALKALSLHEALELSKEDSPVFICGGSEIYQQAIGLAARICLTVVGLDLEGDAFFPETAGFIETGRESISLFPPADFITLERNGTGGGGL